MESGELWNVQGDASYKMENVIHESDFNEVALLVADNMVWLQGWNKQGVLCDPQNWMQMRF